MQKTRVVAAAVLAGGLVVGAGATGAVARDFVTSADVRNHSVRGVDLRADSIGHRHLRPAVTRALAAPEVTSIRLTPFNVRPIYRLELHLRSGHTVHVDGTRAQVDALEVALFDKLQDPAAHGGPVLTLKFDDGPLPGLDTDAVNVEQVERYRVVFLSRTR